MSILWVGLTLKFSKARGATRLVLIAMSDIADDDGVVAASYAEIARLARVSLSTIPSAISTLLGIGEVVPVRGGTGKGHPAIYRLNCINIQHSYTTPILDDDTVFESNHDIPTGLQVDPEEPSVRDLNAATDVSVDHQYPEGAEGVSPSPPDDAPVPPDAGGGTLANTMTSQAMEASHIPEVFRREPMPAVPKPARLMPSFLPPNDVGRILVAAGAELGDNMPLFWWQSEHKIALAQLLDRLGVTIDDAIAAIVANGRKSPDVRRIADLEHLIGR